MYVCEGGGYAYVCECAGECQLNSLITWRACGGGDGEGACPCNFLHFHYAEFIIPLALLMAQGLRICLPMQETQV